MSNKRIQEISCEIYETLQLVRDYCEYNENYDKISPLIPIVKNLNKLADELYFLLREDKMDDH